MANVTDADREARQRWRKHDFNREGAFLLLDQAFARHREEATRELEAKNAELLDRFDDYRKASAENAAETVCYWSAQNAELVEALKRIANYEGGTDYTCQHGMRGIAKDALAKHTGGE